MLVLGVVRLELLLQAGPTSITTLIAAMDIAWTGRWMAVIPISLSLFCVPGPADGVSGDLVRRP